MWETEHQAEKNWNLLFYEIIIETENKRKKKEKKNLNNIINITNVSNNHFFFFSLFDFFVETSRRRHFTWMFLTYYLLSAMFKSLSNVINYAYVSSNSNDLLKISFTKSNSSSKKSNASINLKQSLWALCLNSLMINQWMKKTRMKSSKAKAYFIKRVNISICCHKTCSRLLSCRQKLRKKERRRYRIWF